MRLSWSAVASDLTAVAWVLLVHTSVLGAQRLVKSSAGDASLRTETDRSTYHAGDSIGVRVTLRNVSEHQIRFMGYLPRLLARLRVYDAAGREVKPTSYRDLLLATGSTHPVGLKAGEELILRWHNIDQPGNPPTANS